MSNIKEEICSVLLEDGVCLRKCFMTGEFCSKQGNIQRVRNRLHEQKEINAFVVMNFSNMSDVVYKWRIQQFIQSLSRYLYIKDGKLFCSKCDIDSFSEENKISVENRIKINVLRSDTEPANNYVVCNRICQQLQIADLIIVDVSSQNPNVFYELGMAIAMQKLVLPICYSESYYKMVLPAQVQKMLDDNKYKQEESKDKLEDLKHHIDCYPWRRKLFEYYGIIFRHKTNNGGMKKTKYLEFKRVKNPKYGFSDIKYGRFPYHENFNKDSGIIIGEVIYDNLKRSFEKSDYGDNTLVVYNLDGFLNVEQAGICVINFYKKITEKLEENHCFCGERVGVWVQENSIPENDKDTKTQLYLNYNVGEIIHIGVNQAAYLASSKKITAGDCLKYDSEKEDMKNDKADIKRYIKGYIGNKGLLVYPNNPVFVERLNKELQVGILEPDRFEENDFFLLYYVMLRTLRYVNRIVVDISNNNLQSLFWLGIAHGKGINAITVIHEATEKEREIVAGIKEKKERNVFDVAGLWTAVFRSNDTDGFYRQLEAVYEGLERHSKLIISEHNYWEEEVDSNLAFSDNTETELLDFLNKRKIEEKKMLESYYRNCFLNQMLCYNKLYLYLRKGDMTGTNNQPKGYTSKWDFEAVSALSNYLSKRTLIGEYRLCNVIDKNDSSKRSGHIQEAPESVNFICIGQDAKPLKEDYVMARNEKLEGHKIHTKWQFLREQKIDRENGKKDECNFIYKGYVREIDDAKMTSEVIATQHTGLQCASCIKCEKNSCSVKHYESSMVDILNSFQKETCEVSSGEHIELGQLILWREQPENNKERSYFQVELNGTSGPATLALATLFINEEQKREHLSNIHEKYDIDNYVLCKLQRAIREQLINKFKEILEQKAKEIETKDIRKRAEAFEKYMKLVLYATQNYLSAILYHHFLPFLSIQDIECIKNSMEYFIKSMKAESRSPFSLDYEAWRAGTNDNVVGNDTVNKVIDIIPKVLLSVLNSFKGVEAFYEVKVAHKNVSKEVQMEDTRELLEICELNEVNKVKAVNCLFSSGVDI